MRMNGDAVGDIRRLNFLKTTPSLRRKNHAIKPKNIQCYNELHKSQLRTASK